MGVLVPTTVLDVHHVLVTVHHVVGHVQQAVVDAHHVLDALEHVRTVV